MPEVEIAIGGRSFTVACQPGEEHFLRTAAQMLDIEAQPIIAQMGRIPEAKMLLMAGLMLADKTAAVEDELRVLRARVAELEARPTPAPERVEVAVIPPQVAETLAEIAARAEALAARAAERAAERARG
jgi:cell division protein ZapA